ncbi:MAG: hypothetical protein C0437_16875 [Ralstonia sp.]|nr:hypothetical protein [Ralstonia sp.]
MHPASLPPEAFMRIDPSDDERFYAEPRLVMHIDEAAAAALTGLYDALLPPDGAVLDLMSAWVSHLPPGFTGQVVNRLRSLTPSGVQE